MNQHIKPDQDFPIKTVSCTEFNCGGGVVPCTCIATVLYNVALPAILRHQGVDLRWIGMLSLLYIPWAFKFFWAPLIDRFYQGTW